MFKDEIVSKRNPQLLPTYEDLLFLCKIAFPWDIKKLQKNLKRKLADLDVFDFS